MGLIQSHQADSIGSHVVTPWSLVSPCIGLQISLLSKPGIFSLRPESITELISDDGMVCEEISLFLVLDEWATAENGVDYFDLGPKAKADRVSIAKDLVATHIRLSSIEPRALNVIVRKLCLVDERMILEALEAQALL